MIWSDAYAAGKVPEITTPGIAYMLAGGSDPSNTDPMAMAPAPDEAWITTPSHIMLLMPGGFDAKQFTTDHASGLPYIMWDGTPYEHLMVPVAQTTREEMGDVDDVVANIMASGAARRPRSMPTIMGNPAKAGDPMVVLRKGDNDWVCNDDRSVSPGNDPSCNDPVWASGPMPSIPARKRRSPVPASPTCSRAAAMRATPIRWPPDRRRARNGSPRRRTSCSSCRCRWTQAISQWHVHQQHLHHVGRHTFQHLMVPVADMRK